MSRRRNDEVVREAVEAELSLDPLVHDADIRVRDAGGAVGLSGTVPSYPQRLEAVAAARRVHGVTAVQDDLDVVLSEDDRREDATLTADAENALRTSATVPATVGASARYGVVTLRGTARSGGQLSAASGAVAGVHGVTDIRDEVDVSPSPVGPASSDPGPTSSGLAGVAALVQDALRRNAGISDHSDVSVAVEDRTLVLSGHVRTQAEHNAVLDAAWGAGASAVRDDLLVLG